MVRESLDVAAPIERVFGVITDPRRAGEWNPNVVEIADFSGYPVGPGTTWRQVAMMAGRPANLLCRVVEWLPPHRGVLSVTGDQKATIVTECTPLANGTRIMQVIDFVPPGGFAGALLARAAQPMIQRELTRSLQQMKTAVEQGP